MAISSISYAKHEADLRMRTRAVATVRAALKLVSVDPMWALRQIAFQLERSGAPTYRVRAFRSAAEVVRCPVMTGRRS
jgi:hypothetical protein